MKFADILSAWAVALWVGGLCAIGYLAAPTLFYTLEDRQLAGMLAGKMFSSMNWVGMVCGGWLVVHRLARFGGGALRQGFFWLALGMLLLTLAQHFGMQPLLQQLKDQAMPKDVMESLFRDRFETWHGISSAVYLLQSLMGLALAAKR